MSRFSQLNQIIQGPFVVHQIKTVCDVSFRAFGLAGSHYYSVHREGFIHQWVRHAYLITAIESLNHVKTN